MTKSHYYHSSFAQSSKPLINTTENYFDNEDDDSSSTETTSIAANTPNTYYQRTDSQMNTPSKIDAYRSEANQERSSSRLSRLSQMTSENRKQESLQNEESFKKQGRVLNAHRSYRPSENGNNLNLPSTNVVMEPKNSTVQPLFFRNRVAAERGGH